MDSRCTIPKTRGERTAFILDTSGSTGRPKGVNHTHKNLIAISDTSITSYEMAFGSTFLAVLPLYHCTGMGTILGPTLKIGGKLLLRKEWDVSATVDLLEENDVNVFSGVPTMYKDLLVESDEAALDTDTLVTGVIGGAGVSEELIHRLKAVLGCPVLNGWGMAETFAGGLWENRSNDREQPSVGRPSGRLFDAKIVDPESGNECPPGQVGELLVRGETMMRGNLETEEEWTEDRLHTGDYAWIDGGFVFILDRIDYTIITGGENVYPREVEDVIEKLDGAIAAAVVAKPDERKGEKPIAFVNSSPGSSLGADDIKEHVLDRLVAYKHPREVIFLDELPMNSGGKRLRRICKRKLRRDVRQILPVRLRRPDHTTTEDVVVEQVLTSESLRFYRPFHRGSLSSSHAVTPSS